MLTDMNVAYKKFACNRCFGVELEVSNTVSQAFIRNVANAHTDRPVRIATRWGQTKGNDYWHIKHDSTCGVLGKGLDKGWEICSFKGHTIEDIVNIAEVTHALYRAGLEVNDNCGFHVHVEAKDYTVKDVTKLIAYWLKIEELLFEAVPFRRSCNDYCRPLRRRMPRKLICSSNDIWAHYSPKNLSPYENPERWQTLNLVNFATGLLYKNYARKTLEFRIPEGTLSAEDVKNWTRLFVHFVSHVKLTHAPATLDSCGLEDALRILGLHHTHDTFFLLSEGLFATKTWLLKRFRRFGCATEQRAATELLNEMWSPEKTFILY